MEKKRFTIEIHASKEKVWSTLFDDATFRDWGSIIDEGQYKVGEMKEGNEIQFMSSENGYGVTSLVEKLIPNEFVSFRQMADTKENGQQEREKEWTGGAESYSLSEQDGMTTVTIEIDVPDGLEELFEDRFPKALLRVKALAEGKNSF